MARALNTIYQGDCIEGLATLEAGSVDLAFADPPFNIGYEYDVYHDSRSSAEYLDWTRRWMAGVARALKPTGTFWLAIGDEYAAELKLIAQNDAGFTCRSWVIWYYTFGVNCKYGFSRSHTHLFHFVKDPRNFTFNADNPAIRVPSARQLVYADGRANPKGRLPDNTWILRPQDVPNGFAPDQDIWFFSRVAGTFKERQGFHGCQMPEQLLGRIIRCCSNPVEVVLDPFGGSGTTLAVAKKLGRQWIGFELSKEYVAKIKVRLKNTRSGDPLDGPDDPVTSAPPTALGKRRGVVSKCANRKRSPRHRNPVEQSRELEKGVVDAYLLSHDGWSADHLLADPAQNATFIDACTKKGLPGDPIEWNRVLLRVRKAGKLPPAGKRLRLFTFGEMDPYSFASEIAVQQLTVDCAVTSLDDILCSPQLAAKFDEIAAVYSPGFTSFQYRWAAFTIRKRASAAKKLAAERFAEWERLKLPRGRSFSCKDWSAFDCPGVYVLSAARREQLYVGATVNLRRRIEQTTTVPVWECWHPAAIRLIPESDKPYGLQAFLIRRINPVMNWRLLVSDLEATA